MIDTIIFDVGRVLVNFDWSQRFDELGYDEDTQMHVVEAMFKGPVWNEFDRSALSDEKLLQKFIANAPDYADEIIEIFSHVELLIQMYPYSMDWIQSLKDRNYRVYILSNYAKSTYAKTQDDLAFLSLADGALFSFECNFIKPEPDIYRTLLDRFSIIPEHAIFIDDRMDNLTAAEAFGIHPILFTTYNETSKLLEQCLKTEK